MRVSVLFAVTLNLSTTQFEQFAANDLVWFTAITVHLSKVYTYWNVLIPCDGCAGQVSFRRINPYFILTQRHILARNSYKGQGDYCSETL